MLSVGLLFSSSVLANQRCFKCRGSGVWHTDNKIPYSGKVCNSVLNVMVTVNQDKFLILPNAAIYIKVQVCFMATKGFVSEQDLAVARPVYLVGMETKYKEESS